MSYGDVIPDRARYLGRLHGVTAISGNNALITGPEVTASRSTCCGQVPFRSYAAPGLILSAMVVGGSAVLARVVGLRRPRIGLYPGDLPGY